MCSRWCMRQFDDLDRGSNRCASSSRQSSVPGESTAAEPAATAIRNARSSDSPEKSCYEPTQKTVTGTDGAYCLDSGAGRGSALSAVTRSAPWSPSVSATACALPSDVSLRHAATRARVAVEWRTPGDRTARQVRLDQRDPFLQSFLCSAPRCR